MFALVRRFAAICVLQAGPQDLPASRFLLRAVLLLYVLLNGILLGSLYGLGEAMLQTLAGTAGLVVFTLILLWRTRYARIPQTLTALFGIGILFGLIFWPLLVVAGMPADLRTLLTLAILVWSLLAMGHVLAKALDWPLAGGFVLALCYDLTSYYLTALLLPAS